MTRVALCLSGQPRMALETYPFIYKYIIEPNNADVFIHMNYDSKSNYILKTHLDNGVCQYNSDIDKHVIEVYKPKRYCIEMPRIFTNPNIEISDSQLQAYLNMNKNKNMSAEHMKSHVLNSLQSMFYSIYKANELKQLYANENGFTYDYVIRLRFDAKPSRPLICELYNPNYIYYEEIGQKDELISDWFNFGSNAIMNVYASIFLQLEYLSTFTFLSKEHRAQTLLYPSEVCGAIFEHNIRDIMNLFKIPKKGISLGLSLLV